MRIRPDKPPITTIRNQQDAQRLRAWAILEVAQGRMDAKLLKVIRRGINETLAILAMEKALAARKAKRRQKAKRIPKEGA